MDASALMRLERGERRVGVDDLLALALALDVAPVYLIVPLDNDAELNIGDGVTDTAGAVRRWICGARPLEGVESDHYHRQTAVGRWEQRTSFFERVAELDAAETEALEAGDEEAASQARRQRAQLNANRLRVERGGPTMEY